MTLSVCCDTFRFPAEIGSPYSSGTSTLPRSLLQTAPQTPNVTRSTDFVLGIHITDVHVVVASETLWPQVVRLADFHVAENLCLVFPGGDRLHNSKVNEVQYSSNDVQYRRL